MGRREWFTLRNWIACAQQISKSRCRSALRHNQHAVLSHRIVLAGSRCRWPTRHGAGGRGGRSRVADVKRYWARVHHRHRYDSIGADAGMMLDTVTAAIATSAFDDDVKAQLSACLPMLTTAVDNSAVMQGGLTIAAATPKGGIVFNAKGGWPDIDDEVAAQHVQAAVAQAMYAAIESKTYQGDTILNGLTSMLGSAGVAAADADLSLIADTGQAPMIVLLAVHLGTAILTLITSAGLAQRTLH
jgi:hypothetical protein